MKRWAYIRPDAVTALEDPVVQKVLPRYVKVVENKLPASFQILKKVPVELPQSLESEDMKKLHTKTMKKFRTLKKKIDKKKIALDGLKTPQFSLLDLKVYIAREIMENCRFCEWKCGTNRMKNELGVCKVGKVAVISSEHIHYGEESYITPSHTIFFWSCNFDCVFCQNYTISKRLENGIPVTPTVLAKVIEERRKQGSRNVNFVGGEPTPYIFHILQALKEVRVNVPVVWNSNMYMSEEAMQILDGVVDVYLTDFKYGNDICAMRLSKVPRYFDVVTRNHLVAVKQAEVVVRHLVMPNHLKCCTQHVLEWLAENVREKVLVNIMDQYTPYYRAKEHNDIARKLYPEEFKWALKKAVDLGLNVKS
ncbi:MAG: radical SAM protein [Candidatus Aenigmarchaeota archaeon]|nr:radical SAM protein [Candidatus Aenigmarchaeota archaeon]